jgi:hypothetical protein
MHKFFTLPDEVLVEIFTYLSPKDLNSVSLSCRNFHYNSTNDIVWSTIAQLYFNSENARNRDVYPISNFRQHYIARRKESAEQKMLPRRISRMNKTIVRTQTEIAYAYFVGMLCWTSYLLFRTINQQNTDMMFLNFLIFVLPYVVLLVTILYVPMFYRKKLEHWQKLSKIPIRNQTFLNKQSSTSLFVASCIWIPLQATLVIYQGRNFTVLPFFLFTLCYGIATLVRWRYCTLNREFNGWIQGHLVFLTFLLLQMAMIRMKLDGIVLMISWLVVWSPTILVLLLLLSFLSKRITDLRFFIINNRAIPFCMCLMSLITIAIVSMRFDGLNISPAIIVTFMSVSVVLVSVTCYDIVKRYSQLRLLHW